MGAIPRGLLVAHLGHPFVLQIVNLFDVLLDEVDFVLLGNVVRVPHLQHVF